MRSVRACRVASSDSSSCPRPEKVFSKSLWNFETKFADTAAHAIHRRVVLARVAGVKDQLVDGPHLDFRRYFSWHHNAPVSGPATIPALLTIRVGSMNPK